MEENRKLYYKLTNIFINGWFYKRKSSNETNKKKKISLVYPYRIILIEFTVVLAAYNLWLNPALRGKAKGRNDPCAGTTHSTSIHWTEHAAHNAWESSV